MTKSLAIFGATGSIGASTLDLVRCQPALYRASILTGHANVSAMKALVQEFQPDLVVMSAPGAAEALRQVLPTPAHILSGEQGLIDAAQAPYDLMVAAIVGFAGLAPTYAALKLGRDVALANKEALVCAGEFMIAEAAASGAKILPVDSEHNAIFQCLETRNRAQIHSIQLTASGGPFRGWSAAQIAEATLAQALRHPNWSMGAKITIDSATLMNKALEMIEARWLFDVHGDQLQVVIHPQSVVHSCVTYQDGSTLAQLGNPDMRTPIAYCLAYPDRAHRGGTPLNLTTLSGLSFETPDEEAFPTLALARAAMLDDGQGTSIALNAINEILNGAVRENRLPFGKLISSLTSMMQSLDMPRVASMTDVFAWDAQVRAKTEEQVRFWTR